MKQQQSTTQTDTGAKSESQSAVVPNAAAQSAAGVQSPLNPATHPYRTTFIQRVEAVFAGLTPEGGTPAQFAADAWDEVCLAVIRAAPSMSDPAAYSNYERGWVDMTSPQFVKALSEFDTVIESFNEASSSQFANANSFGFWSKPSGRALAESCSDLTLESTRAGAIFDDFPSLEGGDGWDPELWGAMSQGYAAAVAAQVLNSDKTIKVCIGPGRNPGNIWDSIESKAFGGSKSDISHFQDATTYYAAFTASKDSKELDSNFNEGGVSGAGYAGKSESDAVSLADKHNKSHLAPSKGKAK